MACKHSAFVWFIAVRVVAFNSAKVLPMTFRFWSSVMIMGVINNFLPFNFIAFGQLFVTGGMASIINANTAFMGVIVSGIFLSNEPATWNRVVGVIIGVAGVAIAIGVTPALLTADTSNLFVGSLAIVLATVAYAFAGVWGKLKLSEYSSTQSAVGIHMFFSCCSVMQFSHLWAAKSCNNKLPIRPNTGGLRIGRFRNCTGLSVVF